MLKRLERLRASQPSVQPKYPAAQVDFTLDLKKPIPFMNQPADLRLKVLSLSSANFHH